MRDIFLSQRRQEQVNICDLLDLVDEKCNIGQELPRCMIVKNVHVNSLSPAVSEGFFIVLLLDEFADTCNNHCTREDGFEVASWHLENEAQGHWHSCDQPCSTLNTAAALILFRVIRWN